MPLFGGGRDDLVEPNFFTYVWRHSRKEQIVVLLFVLFSLPFYWASLDIPRVIVNDAIQGRAFKDGITQIHGFQLHFTLPSFLGGTKFEISEGFLLNQFQYLFALSFLFLGFTLINGAFKYAINVRKGILGERMLRRLRFELFQLVMRFRPEEIRATKSAEISSMIKDEVEPIGGFFGEAFITPVFLSTQALTALAFILVQDIWLGLLTALIIGVQSIIIPRLRKEQIRLGWQRQIASRKLAGRIGEIVDAAPMLHAHGLVANQSADIGDRLGNLFRIRLALFRRKFSVKFLNNLLAQITPFLFYTLGGYLALTGQLDIGQLVAVIAAYRDLPTPVKELIDWDQQRADVTVKFEQVVKVFSRELMPGIEDQPELQPELLSVLPIRISGLKHVDRRSGTLLDPLNFDLDHPAHIALVGPQGGGNVILARILGRQVSDFSGKLTLAGQSMDALSTDFLSRHILYLGSDPYVMSGSVRDNLCLALRRHQPPKVDDPEAERTGNPLYPVEADWHDYAHIGIDGPEGLDQVIIDALHVVGAYDRVFTAGLAERLGDAIEIDIQERLIAARDAIHTRLQESSLTDLVEFFDARRFNSMATLGENLLFGNCVGTRFAPENIALDPFFRSILDAESLTEPLVKIGIRIAETVVDVRRETAPGSSILERYAFVAQTELDVLKRIISDGTSRRKNAAHLAARSALIGFALSYIEQRHRLGLVDDALKDRILRARLSFKTYLSTDAQKSVEFYVSSTLQASMTLRENLLFGRIAGGTLRAEERIEALIREVLQQHDLVGVVVRQGLSREAGPGGRLLAAEQRAMIALTRAVLTRPEVLILDNALGVLDPAQQQDVMARLLKHFAGRTLFVTFPTGAATAGFDCVLTFNGHRLAQAKPDRDQNSVREAVSTAAGGS